MRHLVVRAAKIHLADTRVGGDLLRRASTRMRPPTMTMMRLANLPHVARAEALGGAAVNGAEQSVACGTTC